MNNYWITYKINAWIYHFILNNDIIYQNLVKYLVQVPHNVLDDVYNY